jgi:prolyl-tRNA synthetase
MGCHGIGVSRLIGAIASLLADSKGLNWPLAISPFQVLIVSHGQDADDYAEVVYDSLLQTGLARLTEEGMRSASIIGASATQWDVVIDDRHRPMGWKFNDADLIGYLIILVMGAN